jgi:uncharacterized protein YkwD
MKLATILDSRKCFMLALFLMSFIAGLSQKPAKEDKHKGESELLALINEVRTTPKKFLTNKALPYIIENDEDTVVNKYVSSLLKDLRKQSSIGPLESDPYLHDQAHSFAADMGSTGSVGHSSSKLGDFGKRLKKYSNKEIGENCDYGSNDPLDILMNLLIDEDIVGVGHRRNLLNPRYKLIGLGIEPHRTYEWNCVMDFSN